MAIPTAPTLSSICSEAVQRAGYSSTTIQYATALTRAQNEWIEQVKDDIFTFEKQLTPLMKSTVQIATLGQSLYTFPADFSSIRQMTLLDGATTGLARGGTLNSITLTALDAGTSNGYLGKQILVYAGTAINQMAQIIAFNATTKLATITPAFTVAPVIGDSYMIIDNYFDINPMPVDDYDNYATSTMPGIPNSFAPIGDPSTGSYYLYPTPSRSSGIPWGIAIRYFADLTLLDLAGPTMATIYRRWRNLLTQGVFVKCLQSYDDNRTQKELETYYALVAAVCSREKYGTEVPSDIQFAVQRRR
jgi:hypothetical protein